MFRSFTFMSLESINLCGFFLLKTNKLKFVIRFLICKKFDSIVPKHSRFKLECQAKVRRIGSQMNL